LETNPYDFRVLALMGYFQLEKEDYKAAKRFFQQAIQNAESDYYKASGTLFLSRFYYCYSNLDEAIRLAKFAIEKYPSVEEADYILATLYSQKGNAKAALKKIDEVLKSNTSYYAGLFYSRDFHTINSPLFSHLRKKIRSLQKQSGKMIEETSQIIKEAKKEEATFYDPVKFKTASSRLSYSRRQMEKNSLLSILEAHRLVNESHLQALKTKEYSFDKKIAARKKLSNIRDNTKKANVYVSIAIGCVAGVAGVIFGVAHTWFKGEESSYSIPVYAVSFFLVTFIGVWVSNTMQYTMRERSIFSIIRQKLKNDKTLEHEK
jgi:tetratricopeptide (TPR) repeat protein